VLITGPTGVASPGSPAPSATRPAATAGECSTSGCRDCSRRSRCRAATGATPAAEDRARAELLILDDWGLSGLAQAEREDLLEILEDRHGRGSTIVTSQVPVEQWHEVIGGPNNRDLPHGGSD
jgi:hypothetical protein